MPGRGDSGDGESKGGGSEEFELLDKVQDFCTSEFLEENFQQFARKHYKLFLDAAAEGSWSTVGAVEHKLEYTDVYNLFLEHFEGKFSEFIKEEGGTSEQFQQECKDVLQTLEPYSPRRFFVEILLATTDYDHFFFLMVGEAHRLGQEEKDMEKEGEGFSSSSHK
eukprot:jgi/Undpi1/3941/HiC_scaffold_16.g07309.m1